MSIDARTELSTETMEELVQRQLNGRVRDLRVLLQDQGIILRGQTSTYYVKQLAQHAAMEVSGLPIVANDIEVR